MNKPITAKVNSKGHLEIGGCDTIDLAKQFGTPLYILDELTIRDRCRQYVSTLKLKYPDSLAVYASKALCNAAVLKIVNDEGMGIDVSSGGELYTAKKAKCDLSRVYFHGNNKSAKEIEEGVEAGVKFVVDNFSELNTLGEAAEKAGKKTDLLFRVNPGIEAHTHEFIQTGKIDSKFGIQKEQVLECCRAIRELPLINFIGLHTHIGSQILEINPFKSEADILFSLAEDIKKETGITVGELNFGGGWGVSYIGENPPPIAKLVEAMIEKIKSKNFSGKIVFEPGRSIVANAGVTLYTIGCVKDIPGIRKYVLVDGGMSDNPRPILYDAKYDALIANRAGEKGEERVRVAGRFCESGDVLIKEIKLAKPSEKDILAVMTTGAYNYSMASNYNRVPRPAMVMVNNGKANLIVKRETYEDLTAGDILA